MFNGVNEIFYRYDYDRNFKLAPIDLQKNGKTPEEFQRDVNKLSSVEQNYLYTFVIDENLRKSLNIQDAKGLYKTNDQEIEEIKLRWPYSGDKIVTSALDYSLRPAVVASIFEAELLIDPALDKKLDQESVRYRVNAFKNDYLRKNNNNYLYALAEYRLSFSGKGYSGILKGWKDNYKKNGSNIRLGEEYDLGAASGDLTKRQSAAGLIAAAYVQEDTPAYNFIQKFMNSFKHYTQRVSESGFFPQWIVSKLKNSELSSLFVSRLNPWYWAGLSNCEPEPSAVRSLDGTYFQVYKKLAYLGLADSGMNNFTNANLVKTLKYSGYISLGFSDLSDLKAYRYDGDLKHIFPEEKAQKLLTVLDSYIERIEMNQKVISNISALKTMFFRREYESNFLDIIYDAADQLKTEPQQLIEIYYQGAKLSGWRFNRSSKIRNYLYTILVAVEPFKEKAQKRVRLEECQVVISPRLKIYLENKYKLGIEDYDKKTQENFVKDFFRTINSNSSGQIVNYDDFVDGFLGEINYAKLYRFLNDFLLDSPAFGRPEYYVTSGYGFRRDPTVKDPILKVFEHHNGVDLQGNIGDPIYAVSGGEVFFAGYEEGYGNLVKIRQSDNTEIIYAHCDNITKNKGDKVIAGEQIATIGNSGKTTGPHIHIEYRQNGKPVPPVNFDITVWEALADFYKKNRQRYQY